GASPARGTGTPGLEPRRRPRAATAPAGTAAPAQRGREGMRRGIPPASGRRRSLPGIPAAAPVCPSSSLFWRQFRVLGRHQDLKALHTLVLEYLYVVFLLRQGLGCIRDGEAGGEAEDDDLSLSLGQQLHG